MFLLFLLKVYQAGGGKPNSTQKSPCIRGLLLSCSFPSSCGTIRRNWHPSCKVASGLSGFIGPFPSTSLDESRSHYICSVVYVRLFTCFSIPKQSQECQDQVPLQKRTTRCPTPTNSGICPAQG